MREGDVLVAIDRIEDEVMGEYPQATRVFIEPESLNQVYRQRRDRRLEFAAYEEEKRHEERLGEFVMERRQRDEERLNDLRERRRLRREAIASAYGKLRARQEAPAPDVAGAAEGALEEPAPRKKLFSEIPCIEGERLVLDRVVDADADALRDLVDNQHVQRYEPMYLYEKRFDDVHEAIRCMYGEVFENGESLILAVRVKSTGELAGLVEFYGLRVDLHKISVGCRLREGFWGQGFATEATRLMVGYLYGETDIEIITATTAVGDEASAHTLEKVDFIRTARGVEEDWGYPEPTLVDKWFC